MFNIRNIGNIDTMDELTSGEGLPDNAVRFRESDKLSDVFYDGLIISMPLLAIVIGATIYRYNSVPEDLHFTQITWITLALTAIVTYFMSYVHEFIHALFYPMNSSKTICQIKSQGAHLLYCDAKVSKSRFVLICLAPVLILGVIPFIVWLLFAPLIPMPFNFSFVVFYIVMFISALGDYANVFNTLRQVPNGAKVFNYGFHSYWINEGK